MSLNELIPKAIEDYEFTNGKMTSEQREFFIAGCLEVARNIRGE